VVWPQRDNENFLSKEGISFVVSRSIGKLRNTFPGLLVKTHNRSTTKVRRIPNFSCAISLSLDNSVRVLYAHDFEDIIAGFGGQK
jgi:hypothetical protein